MGRIENCDSPFSLRQFLLHNKTKAEIVFFILLIQMKGNYHGSELYSFQRIGIWESFWCQLLNKNLKVILKPKIQSHIYLVASKEWRTVQHFIIQKHHRVSNIKCILKFKTTCQIDPVQCKLLVACFWLSNLYF